MQLRANVFNITTGCFDKKQWKEVNTDHYNQTVYVCKQKRLLLPDMFFKDLKEIHT